MKLAAVLLLCGIAVGGLLMLREGNGRGRVDDLLATTIEFSGVEDEYMRFPVGLDTRTLDCDGEEARYVKSQAYFNLMWVAFDEAASNAAQRFEKDGWEVRRHVPDGGADTSGYWLVDAIRGDEHVLAHFIEGGGVISAIVEPCPKFHPYSNQQLVDEFPIGAASVAQVVGE